MSSKRKVSNGTDVDTDDEMQPNMTNGSQEIEECAEEYLEEHEPMTGGAGGGAAGGKRGRRKVMPVVDADIEQNGDEEHLEETLEDHEDEEEEEAEVETPKLRKPTQHPKKRKDAALLAAALSDDEQPTSSARAARIKEDTVEEEQCRVCTSKEDLVGLFKTVEKETIADMLMIICPTVSVAVKDFMPQFICSTCLDNLTVAVQLKAQCETTERELRKKLSRSKNKVRRPRGYVVIDAPLESDPSDDEPVDDEEFKVTPEVIASSADDSEDSDFGTKKRRSLRGGRKGRRKSVPVTPTPKIKEKKRMGRPPKKRSTPPVEISEEEVEEIETKVKGKKRKIKDEPEEEKPTEFPCDECEQVFNRKLSLVLHKKVHSVDRQIFNCEICGQQFKQNGAYKKHVQKHIDEPAGFECNKCEQVLNTKTELKRHLAEEHGEKGPIFQCEKCKKQFVSQVRFERHGERCPGFESKPKIRLNDAECYTAGKDLFKSVAPLTTTYWSDSFSD